MHEHEPCTCLVQNGKPAILVRITEKGIPNKEASVPTEAHHYASVWGKPESMFWPARPGVEMKKLTIFHFNTPHQTFTRSSRDEIWKIRAVYDVKRTSSQRPLSIKTSRAPEYQMEVLFIIRANYSELHHLASSRTAQLARAIPYIVLGWRRKKSCLPNKASTVRAWTLPHAIISRPVEAAHVGTE